MASSTSAVQTLAVVAKGAVETVSSVMRRGGVYINCGMTGMNFFLTSHAFTQMDKVVGGARGEMGVEDERDSTDARSPHGDVDETPLVALLGHVETQHLLLANHVVSHDRWFSIFFRPQKNKPPC